MYIYVYRFILIEESLEEFEFCYIQSLYCGISLQEFYLQATSFELLMEDLKSEKVLVINGAKGVG